jgi:hypothetical protein
MRMVCSYRGKEKVFETSATEFMFGRAEDKFPIGLDLAPDAKASRLHGRIWFEDDHWWIEDLTSSHGTRLNDREIKGEDRNRLQLRDLIQAGETTMRIESFGAEAAMVQTNYLESGAALPGEEFRGQSFHYPPRGCDPGPSRADPGQRG